MNKKYVFLDLDGTILDYQTHSVPESAIIAMRQARENGHELILTTGRPPSLFYGIDKELGFHSYIGANGRVVVHEGQIIYDSPISEVAIEKLSKVCHAEKIDIAYEGLDEFALESTYSNLYKQFCDHFNLQYPVLLPGYYKGRKIYQVSLFYDQVDFTHLEKQLPELSFSYSCKYGLDITTPGGYKDVGIRVFVERFQLDIKDVIAIGDGYNDISMLEYAGTGVAMGNAYDGVHEHADLVTDRIENDGLYKAFKTLKLI